MAYSATYTIIIKAPQAKVFDYVADVSRHGEWGSTADAMKISAEKPGPPAVGARYRADALLNGKQNKSTVTIKALEPPKRIEIFYLGGNPRRKFRGIKSADRTDTTASISVPVFSLAPYGLMCSAPGLRLGRSGPARCARSSHFLQLDAVHL